MKRIRLFTHPLAAGLILGAVGFIAGVILSACQSSGIVCSAGLSRCGLGCADFKSDSQNCGACGVACQSLQICQDSACQCRPGATRCGSSCVVTSSDPQNCGGCSDGGGFSCGATQVCNQGQCADRCRSRVSPRGHPARPEGLRPARCRNMPRPHRSCRFLHRDSFDR